VEQLRQEKLEIDQQLGYNDRGNGDNTGNYRGGGGGAGGPGGAGNNRRGIRRIKWVFSECECPHKVKQDRYRLSFV